MLIDFRRPRTTAPIATIGAALARILPPLAVARLVVLLLLVAGCGWRVAGDAAWRDITVRDLARWRGKESA